jgi:SAM-dependent methyltransferase
MAEPPHDDWTTGFFDEWYIQLFGFPNDEVSDADVAALRQLLPEPPARVLDAACGVGRHSLRLARLGYDVVALDSSSILLGLLRDAASEAGLAVEVVESDLREIPFEEEFDAVLNLQTAWGYYDDHENQRGLDRMARALRDDGLFIQEIAHRDWIVAHFLPKHWQVLADGTIVWIERAFDPVAGVTAASHRWRRPDGSSGERRHRLRLYTATEIDWMLQAAGLHAEAWYAGLSLEPFTLGARRLAVAARRL